LDDKEISEEAAVCKISVQQCAEEYEGILEIQKQHGV
jgi:hypothetical protein